LEGVVKFGKDRSHRGGEPIYKANKSNPDGSKEACMIYTSLEGEGRISKAREKIINFMVSNYIILELLPEDSRSVYAPKMIGHKVIEKNDEKGFIDREYCVSYELRHLAYSIPKITPKDYAEFLGRDIARFMYCGLNNEPRHIRPNFRDNSFRTSMIDMITEPRVFKWIVADSYTIGGANYGRQLEDENDFFKGVSNYFLNTYLPDRMRTDDTIIKLNSIFSCSFVEEVKRLKGIDVTDRFSLIYLEELKKYRKKISLFLNRRKGVHRKSIIKTHSRR